MSDYEDNPRASDGMNSCWDEDDDNGDDGDDDEDNNSENYIDKNDDNLEGEDGGNDGSGSQDEDEDLQPASKRPRFDSTSELNSEAHADNGTTSSENIKPAQYDWSHLPIASRIMGKMGHKPGTGLGKHGQGIVEPLMASDQRGTRGLGYQPDECSVQRKVDPQVEAISLEEHVFWLDNIYPLSDVLTSNIKKWMKEGPEKLDYDNKDYEFCEKNIIEDILKAKDALGDIEDTMKLKSRARANPFESIKGGIFLNRAAMKMANMDYLFDYMFTNPKDQNGREIIGPKDLLYFADVCAGPGGFSEYVFFRKKWKAKGFGFTLRKMNDFKLEEFFAGPSESFEPHYGVPIDHELGDGDIFKLENIESFSSFVLENTNGVGVHFMMADGGFSLNEKSFQEIISKQLYLCQCLVALKIIRVNGNFVVKLFDVFTPFSVGLIYLMYRSFDRISIHKPNTSRPANSERYLICQYKRKGCTDVVDYLSQVNKILNERHEKNRDVLELVPMNILKKDKNFYDYIVESNNRLGKRQIFHLENMVYHSNYREMHDTRQEHFRTECLKLWQVPNEARTDPYKGDSNSVLNKLSLSITDLKRLNETPLEIDREKLKNLSNWHYAVVENEEKNESLTFYLGLGRMNVLRYFRGRFVKCKDLGNFQLPVGTLVYGEVVRENVVKPNQDKVQYHVSAFHIVDGLFLGYEDIRDKNILDRNEICGLFAKALSSQNMIYRVKKIETLRENPYRDLSLTLMKYVKQRRLKNGKDVLGYDIDTNRFIVPGGLLFFPQMRDGWTLHKSTKKDGYYYCNRSRECSIWKVDPLNPDCDAKDREMYEAEYCEIYPDFQTSFLKRQVWWTNDVDLAQLQKEYHN